MSVVKVLFIGDVVGRAGCLAVEKVLPNLKSNHGIDFVVANAENAAQGNGLSKEEAQFLFDCGCNVLTGGNHSFRQSGVFNLFKNDDNNYVLRPANLSKRGPGRGYCIFISDSFSVAVINLMGQVYLNATSSAFDEVDYFLNRIKSKLILVDFHAEATGEKGALAHYLDGRVSAVLGTHTHVQTNDERILPKGTGFITDVGMVGPCNNSVLGVCADCVIRRITTNLPTRFEVKDGPCVFNAVLLELNSDTGHCEKISKIKIDSI